MLCFPKPTSRLFSLQTQDVSAVYVVMQLHLYKIALQVSRCMCKNDLFSCVPFLRFGWTHEITCGDPSVYPDGGWDETSCQRTVHWLHTYIVIFHQKGNQAQCLGSEGLKEPIATVTKQHQVLAWDSCDLLIQCTRPVLSHLPAHLGHRDK